MLLIRLLPFDNFKQKIILIVSIFILKMLKFNIIRLL